MTFFNLLLRDRPRAEIGFITIDDQCYPLFNYFNPDSFDYWLSSADALLYHGKYIIGIISDAIWNNTPYAEKLYFAATPLLKAVKDSKDIEIDDFTDEKYTGIIYIDYL